ncbi:RDD family protein, putative [Mycolicibacterium smegmatis MKD8]|uniref:RDD family protein, putative n=1 Tax=Mycolicibacterium smegmatis (strain MKD8) TaxID=1214915 RepID=A0A2U9PQX6_MYCSE|nr:RDD family protein, putative [Mycolicibacterium smegmatis MKD8]
MGRRFFARVIDGIIVGIVSSLLALFTNSLSNIWVTGLLTGLLTFVYYVGFEVLQGWTPGKKILGLSVRGAASPKPTAKESAIRNSWTLLPIIPFVGGFLGVIAIIVIAVTISSSPTKQGKHDEFAGGTQVLHG